MAMSFRIQIQQLSRKEKFPLLHMLVTYRVEWLIIISGVECGEKDYSGPAQGAEVEMVEKRHSLHNSLL